MQEGNLLRYATNSITVSTVAAAQHAAAVPESQALGSVAASAWVVRRTPVVCPTIIADPAIGCTPVTGYRHFHRRS